MLGENARSFLKEHSTIDENGNAHLSQKAYMDFMAANGVTKEMMDARQEADKELLNGIYLFTTDQLQEKVKKVKEEGGDPSKETVSTTVRIPNGSIDLDLTASKSYPVPRNPGESITKTNVCRLDIRQSRYLDKEMVSSCEADMAKLLGLDL